MKVEIVKTDLRYLESFRRCLDHDCKEGRYLSSPEAPPLDMMRSFVQKNVDEEIPQVFALQDQEVIGWCDIRVYGSPMMAHVGILGIGLLPEYRGRGLGSMLLKKTTDWAREKNLKGLNSKCFLRTHLLLVFIKKLDSSSKARKRRPSSSMVNMKTWFLWVSFSRPSDHVGFLSLRFQ